MQLTTPVTPAQQVAMTNEQAYLIGRPPLGEYLGFMAQTIGGQTLDQRKLADDWREANQRIQQLEATEAGWADAPPIMSVAPELEGLVAQLLADPIYQRSFRIVPTDIALVDLDRLVVFQKHITLDYVRLVQAALGPTPAPDMVFRAAFPLSTEPQPPIQGGRIANNAFAFVSPSTDLRVLDVALLDPSQVNHQVSGRVAGFPGLVVGFGSNFLNAVHAEGRLILNNGSHRAYALRELGITHAPCLVQRVSSAEEFSVLMGNDHVLKNRELYLKAPRPPVLKDYFDPLLRKVVRIPRRARQVKITFMVEAIDIPVTS